MQQHRLGRAILTIALPLAIALSARVAAQTAPPPADDPMLLRVFLIDGRSLVSYGEPARVGDRVVFSMPSAPAADAPLQLVNIAADRVDWARTDRYAASARSKRYIETQAENDYAILSNEIARALNEVSFSNDSQRRLAVAEAARRRLAEWPDQHFHYREGEV